MGRPRDDGDAAQDLARELADIAAQLASLKGEAYNWLLAPDYDALQAPPGERSRRCRGSRGGGEAQGAAQRGARAVNGGKPRLYVWDVWGDQTWRVNNLPGRALKSSLPAGGGAL